MACKKVKRIVFWLCIVILLISVIGVMLYVKKTSDTSEWGITLNCSRVSNKGLTLTLNRDDEGGPPNVYVWEQFTIQELTIKGWEEVENSQYISSQFLNGSGIQIKDKVSHTWELLWEEECGKLPIGVYRITKEIGRVTGTITHYAPFFVMSWWQCLLIVFIALILGCGIWAGIRFGIPKKVKIIGFIVITGCILVIGAYQGLCYYYNCQEGKEVVESLTSWNVKSIGIQHGGEEIHPLTESETKKFLALIDACELGEEITESMLGCGYTHIVVERYIGDDVQLMPYNNLIVIKSKKYVYENGEELDTFMTHLEGKYGL